MSKIIEDRSNYYFVDILREPIFTLLDGGWVTYNSYDALCLNLAQIWIADIDFDDIISRRQWQKRCKKEDVAAFSQFFWGGAEESSFVHDNLRAELVSVSARNIALSLSEGKYRLYETCGGLRIIRIDKPVEPRSRESVKNHISSYTDHRYQQLCLYQNCYRARLTPKPWRESSDEPIRVTQFIGDCDVKKNGRETKVTWGKIKPHGNLAKLIEYHDDKTHAFSDIKLIG